MGVRKPPAAINSKTISNIGMKFDWVVEIMKQLI